MKHIHFYIQKKLKLLPTLGALVFALFFLLPGISLAARIDISPSVLNLSPGQTATLSVSVDSSGEAMNAVSGTLVVPKDILEITGVSKTSSIVSLWVTEPAFSQAAGTVSFEGVVPNPGYTGTNGRILSVTVRGKGAGSGATSFISASVLANDGNGTNILTGLGTASITVSPKATGESPPVTTSPVSSSGVPAAVTINSETHPDSGLWYKASAATFSWENTAGVTGVSVSVDKKENSNPGLNSAGLFETYKREKMEDGVWYVHLRLRNRAGWGSISHRRFQIDTVNPEKLTIKEPIVQTNGAHSRQFIFESEDSMSGIKEFLVRLDNGSEIEVQPEKSATKIRTGVYNRADLSAGRHVIFIKAVDWAGNFAADSLAFEVAEIEPPSVSRYSDTLSSSDFLNIRGSAPPKSTVKVYLRDQSDLIIISEKVPVLDNGSFFYVSDKNLPGGPYKLTLQTELSDGGLSAETKVYAVSVGRGWLTVFSQNLILILSALILLASLVFLFVFLLKRILARMKKTKEHIQEKRSTNEEVFKAMRDEIKKQIDSIEGLSRIRQLTPEENELMNRLKALHNQAETATDK